MKNFCLLLFLIISIENAFSKNINKPIAAQFGFIENKGQIIDQYNNLNRDVLYLYNGSGLHVQLKQGGFSYEVVKTETKSKVKSVNEDVVSRQMLGRKFEEPEEITFYIHRIDISFAGANQNAKITAYEQAADYINYYTTGTPEAGTTNVHHYKKIVYENIYPNIDAEFILNDKKTM